MDSEIHCAQSVARICSVDRLFVIDIACYNINFKFTPYIYIIMLVWLVVHSSVGVVALSLSWSMNDECPRKS
jgi:hypothetical protein